MVKHHKDGWKKNLAVLGDQFVGWWVDMRWNAERLVDSARDRDMRRVLHFCHAFVTSTIEKLYRVWGVVFWIILAGWLLNKFEG